MAKLSELEILLPELRAYARSISAHADAAEDLVHDAVERALRASERPERIEDLRPWLFRVIRNLHFDELRRLRVRREYLACEKRLSNEAGGAADLARDVLIRLAFERLHPDHREVLFLVDIIGLKYAEAAKVIGTPCGTVMSRLSRARRALAEAVDDRVDAKRGMQSKAGEL